MPRIARLQELLVQEVPAMGVVRQRPTPQGDEAVKLSIAQALTSHLQEPFAEGTQSYIPPFFSCISRGCSSPTVFSSVR